jgi:hypothetical protein
MFPSARFLSSDTHVTGVFYNTICCIEAKTACSPQAILDGCRTQDPTLDQSTRGAADVLLIVDVRLALRQAAQGRPCLRRADRVGRSARGLSDAFSASPTWFRLRSVCMVRGIRL